MDIELKVGNKKLIKSYSIALPSSENIISIKIDDISVIFKFLELKNEEALDESQKNWNVDIDESTLTFKMNRSQKKQVQIGTTKGFPKIANINGDDVYLGFAYEARSSNMSFMTISLYMECEDTEK